MTSAGFPAAAEKALADSQLRRNLRKATSTIRAKREGAVAELDDWQQLRDAGEQIKAHAVDHLDVHLEQLERSVTAAGGTVHWAPRRRRGQPHRRRPDRARRAATRWSRSSR